MLNLFLTLKNVLSLRRSILFQVGIKIKEIRRHFYICRISLIMEFILPDWLTGVILNLVQTLDFIVQDSNVYRTSEWNRSKDFQTCLKFVLNLNGQPILQSFDFDSYSCQQLRSKKIKSKPKGKKTLFSINERWFLDLCILYSILKSDSKAEVIVCSIFFKFCDLVWNIILYLFFLVF